MAEINTENAKDINELDAKRIEWLKGVNERDKSIIEWQQNIIREKQETLRKNELSFKENLAKSVSEENNFSLGVSKIIVNKALEDGHSCGLSEVRTYAQTYSDLVVDIINALRKDGTIPCK